MKELLDKISSYNIFNYLFPGVVFGIIISEFTKYKAPLDNILVGAFISYFAGLVISRFGSLIIEPLLIKIGFLKFAKYSDFISASNNDPKIELLSEVNNTYRTLVSMFILVLIIKFYGIAEKSFPVLQGFTAYIFILLLLIMFIFSYKKQTGYITKRIDIKKENS